MRIGVCGVGVVGRATYEGMRQVHDVIGFDPNIEVFRPNLEAMVESSELIFVCVPTPTLQDGSQNLDFVHEALESLNGFTGVVALKSTVLPETTLNLQHEFPKLRLVHQPEFLTERNANKDFLAQEFAFAGGRHLYIHPVSQAYKHICPVIEFSDPTITEMIKYTHNLFLATQVSFLNDIYDACERVDAPYDLVIRSTLGLGKIAASHSKVPGPDGKRGWGGMCFPKDVKAFLHWYGTGLSTIEGALKTNGRVRHEE